MKRRAAAALVLSMTVFLGACGQNKSDTATAEKAVEEAEEAAEEAIETIEENASEAEAAVEEAVIDVSDEARVMSYQEYIDADLDTPVAVETYVQDKQSWWENQATLYTQNEDGAFFIYNAGVSEDDYALLVPGTKIKVTGFKSEWSGEVEIVDGTIEIEDGSFLAEPVDVTALLGSDSLIDHQNELVTFKGLTIVAAGQDENGNDVPFFYNWDNSGSRGDDVYFKAALDGNEYTFTIESYLRDDSTDVYQAAEALSIGDTVDLTGFLYWYEGANPHITDIQKV